MLKNHYENLNNSKLPITGRFQNNLVTYLLKKMGKMKNIDDEWILGFMKTRNRANSWFWLDKVEYGYKPDWDAECTAIIGKAYSLVIRSKWVIRGALFCDGEVDASNEGEVLGYSFPPDYFDDNNPIKKRIKKLEDELT